MTSAVGVLERRRAIAEIGLTPEQAQRLLPRPDLRSTSLEPVTKEQTARADLGRIGVVLLFMAIAFYCTFVLAGVVEEKSSRVVEVLLSRVPADRTARGQDPRDRAGRSCPTGLVIGAGLVALSVSGNTVVPADDAGHDRVDRVLVRPGYAFYSVLYATAGSLVSRQEETQSLRSR